MGKPWLFVNWTDLHFGSKFGPDPTGDKLQRWIYGRMVAAQKEIASTYSGFQIHNGYGGEFTDKGGLQERTLALDVMAPIHKMASNSHAVRGTGYHVGEDGDEDTDVARQLGVPTISEAHQFRLDGKLIWHTHHGPKPGIKPGSRSNSLNSAASDIYYTCLEYGEAIPDLVIYGHYHQLGVGGFPYKAKDGKIRTLQVVASPAWKAPDRYVFQKVPLAPPAQVGVMLYVPSASKLHALVWRVPAQYRRGKVVTK